LIGNTLYQLPLYLEYYRNIFYLGFIGSFGFDDDLIDSKLATILFASASYDCGCSVGVYQQIVINKQRFFFMDLQSIIENYGYAAILIGTFLESSFCSMPPAR
jgi:hypothetical protein